MRKFILPVMVSLFVFVFPAAAFASVDLTATDGSTSSDSTKTATLSVNTGTDSLSEIAFDVQASSGITMSKVTAASDACDTFSYTITGQVLNIQCKYDTATKVSGDIATITFTASSSTYTFKILDNDNLNIGGLTLGNITNISATASTDTSTTSTNLTATSSTETTTSSSFISNLMNYLPYVLIGGAVIFLISIVGILFSRKKEPKVEESAMPVSTPEQQVEVKPEIPVTTPVAAPVSMDNISDSLYTPAPVEKPSIQETLQSNPASEVQSTFVPSQVQVPTNEQNSDLQAILQGELSTEPMTPVTNQKDTPIPIVPEPVASTPVVPDMMSTPVSTPMMSDVTSPVNETPVVPDIMSAPVSTPMTSEITQQDVPELINSDIAAPVNEAPVAELNTTPDQPLPDLQQFVNQQTQQVPEQPTQIGVVDNNVPTTPTSI